jgi:hypothetical protein
MANVFKISIGRQCRTASAELDKAIALRWDRSLDYCRLQGVAFSHRVKSFAAHSNYSLPSNEWQRLDIFSKAHPFLADIPWEDIHMLRPPFVPGKCSAHEVLNAGVVRRGDGFERV